MPGQAAPSSLPPLGQTRTAPLLISPRVVGVVVRAATHQRVWGRFAAPLLQGSRANPTLGGASVYACAASPKLPRARNLAASRSVRSPLTDPRTRHCHACPARVCGLAANLDHKRTSPRRDTAHLRSRTIDTVRCHNSCHVWGCHVPQRSRPRSRLEHQVCSTVERPRCSTAALQVQTCGGHKGSGTHPRTHSR